MNSRRHFYGLLAMAFLLVLCPGVMTSSLYMAQVGGITLEVFLDFYVWLLVIVPRLVPAVGMVFALLSLIFAVGLWMNASPTKPESEA
jgi:hypothetical protein